MDKTAIIIKTLTLWGGITLVFPMVNVTSFLCALLGGAVFTAYNYKHLTVFQTTIYFAAASIAGYLISEELVEYFSFPYRNTVAFLCGTLCLVIVATIHKILPEIIKTRFKK